MENQKTGIYYDIIFILDESGSMQIMGKEPIESVSVYLDNFKKNVSEKSTFTLVTFNFTPKTLIKDLVISTMEKMPEINYEPTGCTALNDAIGFTIDEVLKSSKPNNKIMVIITDGEENASSLYKKDEVKKKIELVESKHDWSVIFIGANIDAFKEGFSMNISSDRTAQFYQNIPGNLTELCRSTSNATVEFTRSRTEGSDVEFKLPKKSRTEITPL